MNSTRKTGMGFLQDSSKTWVKMLLLWENPRSVLLLAMVVYGIISMAGGMPWRVSNRAFLNYQADAFLHGQLNLRVVPDNTVDLTLYKGEYFLYWGPLPSLMMVPFVLVAGINASDVLLSLILGMLNCALFALLLRKAAQQKLIDLSPAQRGALVLFFTLGTAHTPLPATGQVTSITSLSTVLFSLLAFIAVLSFEDQRAFFWTGAALGGVLLSRNSAILIGVILAWYLIQHYRSRGVPTLILWCALGLLPFLAAGGIQAGYNYLRFDSPFVSGIEYHLPSPLFVENIRQYGVLSPHYIPVNIDYMYLRYPISFPFQVNMLGGSMFLLSPLFFAAFYALWAERRRWITWALLITVVVGAIPSLLVVAPGTLQFGPRYTLDFIVPLLLLTALGMRRWPGLLVAVLITISVLQYLLGSLMYAFITG